MPDESVPVGYVMDRDNPDLFVALNLSPKRGSSLLTCIGDDEEIKSTPELGRLLGLPHNTLFPLNSRDYTPRYALSDGKRTLDDPLMPEGHVLRPPLDEKKFIDDAVWEFSFHDKKIRPLH